MRLYVQERVKNPSTNRTSKRNALYPIAVMKINDYRDRLILRNVEN